MADTERPLPEVRELSSLLADQLQDGEEVEEYRARPATALGENYGSTMLALDIVILAKAEDETPQRRRHLHVFCKMLPDDEERRAVFSVSVTFIKELQMYELVVPALARLQRDAGVPDKDLVTHLFPRCYGGRPSLVGDAVDDDAALLLEDLRQRGFASPDRWKGADLETAELVMDKLAMFHALPVALRIKRPQEYRDTVLRACRDFVMNDVPDRAEMGSKFIDAILANVAKVPDVARHADAVERACRAADTDDMPAIREPFASILHNDLWTNNMLLGPDRQVVFIDFQVTRINSPFKDVLFFIFTSVQPDVYAAHLDDLIAAYQASFVRVLDEVGVDTAPFSLSAAVAEVQAVALSELFHILSMLRFLQADPQMIRRYPETFAFREDLGGEGFVEKLGHVLRQYVARGWIK